MPHWMDILTYCVMAWMVVRAIRGNVDRIVTVTVMLIAWWFGEIYALAAGEVLPTHFYWIPDAAVICAIITNQDKTTRAIVAIYVLTMWPIYVALEYGELTRRDGWIALWGLNLAQFILAGMTGERAWDGVAVMRGNRRTVDSPVHDPLEADFSSARSTLKAGERFAYGENPKASGSIG